MPHSNSSSHTHVKAGSGAMPSEERCVSWVKSYRDRIGGVFCKRKTLTISPEVPSFSVLYLGSSSTLQAKGPGCTTTPVQRIWRRSEMGRSGCRMLLSVGARGLRLDHADQKRTEKEPGHLYLLHRVTHCAVDPALPCILTWVYRHQLKHKAVTLRCHAALLSKLDQAKTAENLLNCTLSAALAEFQRLKRRQDAKRQQNRRGTIPLEPIRTVLNQQCAYRPPTQHTNTYSGQKLCSITEDSLGEEEEERNSPLHSYLDEECSEEDEAEVFLIISDLQDLDLQAERTSLSGNCSQSSGEISDNEGPDPPVGTL